MTFSFIVLALFVSNNLFSQVTVGARGGINIASYNDDPFSYMDKDLDKKAIVGVDVAVFSTFKVLSFFSIQPELHWIQKGVKSTMTTADDLDVELTLKYNYLELPLLARFDMNNDLYNINFFVGPSVGYALDGKFEGKNASLSSEDPFLKGDFEEDLEWDSEYGTDGTKDNRFDLSGVVGVGLGYNLGMVNVVLDVRYNLDFTDATNYENTPSPEPDEYFNRGISITAGVAMPIGY